MALSLLICCSLVCRANLKALLPCLSTETPTILPGIDLLYSSLVAKKAACGPPYPIGIPKRCELPTAISAPSSPGVLSFARANKSEINTALPLFLCILLIASLGSFMSPSVPGYCKMPQIISSLISLSSFPITTFKPKGSARVLIISIVCG